LDEREALVVVCDRNVGIIDDDPKAEIDTEPTAARRCR
jgi:hypothetical protein